MPAAPCHAERAWLCARSFAPPGSGLHAAHWIQLLWPPQNLPELLRGYPDKCYYEHLWYGAITPANGYPPFVEASLYASADSCSALWGTCFTLPFSPAARRPGQGGGPKAIGSRSHRGQQALEQRQRTGRQHLELLAADAGVTNLK
jgi:hypothetical protein